MIVCVYVHVCTYITCTCIKLRQRKAKNGKYLEYNAHLWNGGRRDAVDRVHNVIVHMLRTCTVYMYIHPYMYIYTCTCVYQWSSVQTANHLGASERCSESESDNSHSYVCNSITSLISDFLLACGMVSDVWVVTCHCYLHMQSIE